MKISSKVVSLALTLIMAISIIPFSLIESSATQSMSDNFSKTYTLTGNSATDMINIAFAQEGRNGSSLGYTEEWCADFISDCAKLCNQSAEIPFNGGVFDLRDGIINAGGYYTTSSPQPGDICFIYWTDSGTYHTEIVYAVSGSSVSTIGGNTGTNNTLGTRVVKRHAPLTGISTAQILSIVRPAYGNTTVQAPTWAKISLSPQKATYVVNENVTFKFESDQGDVSYEFQIVKDNINFGSPITVPSTTYPTSFSEPGNYSVWVTAVNSAGRANCLQPASFTVTLPYPGVPILSISENNCSTERVKFSWEATSDTTKYILKINNGVNNQTISDIDVINYSIQLPVGSYTATIFSENSDYTTEGSTKSFSVYPPVYYKILNNVVSFNWPLDTSASEYEVRIKKIETNGEIDYSIWGLTETKTSVTLPYGNYRAYIDANGTNHLQKSIDVYFSILPPLEYTIMNHMVSFSWLFDSNASEYEMRIKKIETNGEVDYSVWGLAGTNTSVTLPEGNYRAYVDANGSNYYQKSMDIYFSVLPSVNCTIINDMAAFNWPIDSNASEYEMRIKKIETNGEVDYTVWGLTGTNTSVTLPYGNYRAYVDANGNNYIHKSNDIYFTITKAQEYLIHYDPNGGSNNPSSQTKFYDIAIILSSEEPTRIGYNFLGWSTNNTATSATYDASESFSANANTTLYAVWEKIPIIFDVQDGSSTIIDLSKHLIYGLTKGLNKTDFESNFVKINGNGRFDYTPATNNVGTGTQVNLIDNETNEIIKTYTIVIFGDVNGDGNIDGNDMGTIVEIENYNVIWDPIADAAKIKAADLNGDGNVDSNDAGLMVEVENYNLTVDQRTGLAG